MSVRSFHSVFMATAVAGAALGCYLVSLRVASERAALEQVESRIVMAQRDIRLLQTEIGTRARLSQLERWNVRVLSLSAPTADQILGDKFQLARLIAPERKPALEAPVILASAPASAAPKPQVPGAELAANSQPSPGGLFHEASAKLPERTIGKARVEFPAATSPAPRRAESGSAQAGTNKPGDKPAAAAAPPVARPVRTAKADPLAQHPAKGSTDKAARTDR